MSTLLAPRTALLTTTNLHRRSAVLIAASVALAGCSPAPLNGLLSPPTNTAPAGSVAAAQQGAAVAPAKGGLLSVALSGQALPAGARDVVIVLRTANGEQTRTVAVSAMGGDAPSQVFEGLPEGPIKVRAEIRDAAGKVLASAETEGTILAGERLPLMLRFPLGPGALDLRMAPMDRPDVRAVQKLLDDFEGYIYDHMSVVDMARNPDLLRCMTAFNALTPVVTEMMQSGIQTEFGKNLAGLVNRVTITGIAGGRQQVVSIELEQESLGPTTKAFIIRVPQGPKGAMAVARLELRAAQWEAAQSTDLGNGFRLIALAMPVWSSVEGVKARLELTPDNLSANRVVLEAEVDNPAATPELAFLDDIFAAGYETIQRCYWYYSRTADKPEYVRECYDSPDYYRPRYVRFGGDGAMPFPIPRNLHLSAAFPGGAAGHFTATLEPAERRMSWTGSLAGMSYDGSMTFRAGTSSGRLTTTGARIAARMVDPKYGIEFPISGDVAFHPPDAPNASELDIGAFLMAKAPGYAFPFGRLNVMGVGIDRPGIIYLSQPRIRHEALGDIAEMYYSSTGMLLKLTGHEVRAVSYLTPIERVLRSNSDALGWINPLDGIKYPPFVSEPVQPIYIPRPDPTPSYPPDWTPDPNYSPPPTPSPMPYATPTYDSGDPTGWNNN
ncbi:MAG: hypothetical protein VKO64_00180 [Candidatus Sericytochromatia bacterium]|nr:hypothetical protein [Candidatus Sericytochromatia bacterium]